MDDEEYMQMQQQILLLASFANNTIDPKALDAFITRIQRAESVGSVLHPSLYRKGIEKLEIVKRIALAARRFQKDLPSLAECQAAEEAQKACEALEGRGL